MIPGALVSPPTELRFGSSPEARLTRLFGLVLLLVAVTALLAWCVLLSPFSLRRWELYDPSQTLTVKEPVTFVVYEEYPGAARNAGPPSVLISIRSIGGRKITVVNRGDEGAPTPTAYQTPWHDGRAIAWFTIDRPGNYSMLSFPTGQGGQPGSQSPSVATLDPARLPRVALGREGTPAPVGNITGLLLIAGVPALLGAGVLLIARRRWPALELDTDASIDERNPALSL